MNSPNENKIDLEIEDENLAVTGNAGEIIDEDAPVAFNETSEDDVHGEADVVDEDLDPLDRLPKNAVRNLDGTVTLPLHYPVTIKSKKAGKVRERVFKELTFSRMTGADIRAINAVAEEHQTTVALARTTKTNQAIMNALFDRMMDIDISNSGRVINHFLASGPRATG